MKTFKIAGIEIPSRYVLAPLAGFSDYSLRKMVSDYKAGLVYTEMESCESICYNSKSTIEDAKNTILDKKNENGTKLALQIFGGKKDSVLRSIPIFESLAQYDFLDFNVGCPVPKVMKQKAGSYWLNRQDELIDLLKEMVSISSHPVIVKIRIGFDQITDVVHLTKKIENVGVQAIAVHGRTKKEGFQGLVHYDVIKDIKEHLSIPVIANGGIDETNSLDVFEKTKADALMIGQRAIGYPKVFKDLVDIEEGREIEKTTLESQIRDLRKHLELIYKCKDERDASSIMRGISVRYIKGFVNSSRYRQMLVHSNSLKEYLDITESILEEYRKSKD